MKNLLATLLTLWTFLGVYAQGPTVPSRMKVGNITLKIKDKARKDIQSDVDALHRYPKYFDQKVERAKIYFPIIEKIFKEEGVPDDFKYLIIQESAMISDVVSSSNAVGYWQFKKDAGIEMGLQVDRQVDERKNIFKSTRAAAGYIRKNNQPLDNWIFALLAYNMGPGGIQKYLKKNKKQNGQEINGGTHWYLKKFLAHKVAFEQSMNTRYEVPIKLVPFDQAKGESLKDISKSNGIPLEELQAYNKWLNTAKVPTDDHIVVLPIPAGYDYIALTGGKKPKNKNGVKKPPKAPKQKKEKGQTERPKSSKREQIPAIEPALALNNQFPKIKLSSSATKSSRINGLKGAIVNEGENLMTLARIGNIPLEKLLKYNEMSQTKVISPDEFYYFQKKRTRAEIYYHLVQEGETLWEVAQNYGVTKKSIVQKNRLAKNEKLKPGRVLWLRLKRPREVPAEHRQVSKKSSTIASSKKTAEPMFEKKTENQVQPSGQDNSVIKVDEKKESKEMPVDRKPEKVKKKFPEMSGQKLPPAETEQMAAHYHVVKKGETLYGISKTYDVDIYDLRFWNELDKNSALSIGQEIKILRKAEFSTPKVEKAPVEEVVYIVKKGDTLYSIAKTHKVSVERLKKINVKANNELSIGEKLIIR